MIHLVTAADGAEDFYGYGNEARSETPQQARDLDQAIITAWEGHQRHFIVDNKKDGGFEGKMKASLDVILKSIGLDGSKTHYYEYVLKQNSAGDYIFDRGLKLNKFRILTTLLSNCLVFEKHSFLFLRLTLAM